MAQSVIAHPLASGAPGPRGGAPHFQPELDGIRGLAILAVLLSHGGDVIATLNHTSRHSPSFILLHLLVPGWGGVDLFFVLSGYLITGILLRGRGGPDYFRNFYMRRVLRIFPIYYLTLTLCLLAALASPSFANHIPYSPLEKFSFFIYLQNWPVFWKNWLGFGALWGSFWSLAVEEQFYFVWPTLIQKLRAQWLLGFCAVAVVLEPFSRLWIGHHLTGWSLGILQFPTSRLDGLFLGAAIALYRELKGKQMPLAVFSGAFVMGFAALLFIAARRPFELVDTYSYMETFGISAFAFMSFGLLGASQHNLPRLRRALSVSFLRFFGKYSYGMYVYHLAIFVLIHHIAVRLSPRTSGVLPFFPAIGMILLAIVLTCIVAYVSYTWIEEPILRLKRFFPSAAQHRS